jgi:DNA-binding protein HU-beta
MIFVEVVMNKTELVTMMSKKTQLPKTKCELFLNEFKQVILEVCSKGDDVNLRNFGKFSMQEKRARKFLNPQTKKYYICKAKKMINFKGYRNFKYAVN